MKVCGTCREMKPDDGFSRNKAKSDGLHSKCKSCHSQYLKSHYETHKPYYVAKARQSKIRQFRLNRTFIQSYLAEHPCIDCGEPDPVVLEFDHVRGIKVNSVSELACSLGVPIARLSAEIEKCDVRCANCHRRKTAKQFGYGSAYQT